MTEPTETKTKGKAPILIAYIVSELPGGKKHWSRIGAAWNHGDEKGLSIKLDGEIVLRQPKAKK